MTDFELTPDTIHSATNYDEIEKVRKLLNADSTLAYKKDEMGFTALHYAAKYGFQEILSLLMENGADANQPGYRGMNALHLASFHNQFKISMLLKEQSVTLDYNAVDEAGNSALHYAAMGGSLKNVEFLVENGANVNGTNAKMATPLMCAILHSHENVANEFLSHKECDINHQDCKGETALHFASRCGLNEMITMLLEHGANKYKANIMEQKPVDVAAGPTSVMLLECMNPRRSMHELQMK